MPPPDSSQAELTALDPATADAVVAVLSRAGIAAWQAEEPDEHGDVVVLVPSGLRTEAMREMGQRMEEIQHELRGRRGVQDGGSRQAREGAQPGGAGAAGPDPGDPRQGPPLTMERFADLRLLVVIVLLPLLVVTLAGPFLPRAARLMIFVVLAVALAAELLRRRRSR